VENNKKINKLFRKINREPGWRRGGWEILEPKFRVQSKISY